MSDEHDDKDLSPIEIRAHLATLTAAMQLLATVPVDRLLASYQHYDSIGPILDPTAWSRGVGVRQQNQDILRAAHPLWKKAREIVEAGVVAS